MVLFNQFICACNTDFPNIQVIPNFVIKLFLASSLFAAGMHSEMSAQTSDYPHPFHNPMSPVMLTGEWVPDNSHDINSFKLPKIPSEHAVISDVRYAWGRKTNQHNYLVFYDGYYWAMWSDGPGVSRSEDPVAHRNIVPGHDQPGQLVSYSKSKDGIHWSEPRDLTCPPDDGFGWIARGFWIRNGQLLALATRYNAPDYRGEGLQLHAFELIPQEEREWRPKGLVYDNAMNNFPPKRLPNGEWLMSRRDSTGNVYTLRGGSESFDSWKSFSVISYNDEELKAEEPYWWILPDGKNLVSFYRDNKGSGYLFRAFSTDNGTTWSHPVRTNFPDAKSKFHGIRMSDGRFIMVSNSNPEKRDPLTLGISNDGMVFSKLGYLVGGRHIDYPHVMEHNGYIFVAFAGAKQTVEVLKIKISDLEDIKMPSRNEVSK